MIRYRFSLATLVIAVIAIGVFLGVSRHGTTATCIAAYLVTLSLICLAAVAGVFGDKLTQRASLPFAIFAGAYLAAAMGYSGEFLLGESLVDTFVVFPLIGWENRDAVRVGLECAISLAFGLYGTVACQVYWRFNPPTDDSDRPSGMR